MVGKSFFALLLILSSFAFADTKIPQLDVSDSCYVISDVDELYGFATIVNDGVYKRVNGKDVRSTDKGACGKLTADITVNENVLTAADGSSNLDENGYLFNRYSLRQWLPLKQFSGSFHGQGHVIRGLYASSTATYDMGFIGWLTADNHNKIVIDNLGIEDSYFLGKTNVGALFGSAMGSLSTSLFTVNVNNCYVEAFVMATNGDYGKVGGMTGQFSGFSVLNVRNSYFATTVKGKLEGMVVGKMDLSRYVKKEGSSVTFANEKSDAFFDNVYYVKQGTVPSYTDSSEKTTMTDGVSENENFSISGGKLNALESVKDLASGSVAVSLHNYNKVFENAPEDNVYGLVWGQQGDRPDFSGVVKTDLLKSQKLRTVSFVVDGEVVGEYYLQGDKKYPVPNFDEKDFVILNWYPYESLSGTKLDTEFSLYSSDLTFYGKVLKKSSDGFIEIDDLDALKNFAAVVNGKNVKQNSFINGRLNADIDLSPMYPVGTISSWTPMGTAEKPFRGNFLGQGHTISNLKFYDAIQGAGFFGYAGDSTHDIVIEDVRFSGVNITNQKTGGTGVLVGVANGKLFVRNIFVGGYVFGNSYTGGIVGKAHDVEAYNVAITGSVVNKDTVGSVSGGSYIGGIVGGFADKSVAKLTVGGAYISSSIRADSRSGVIAGESLAEGNLKINNCVYIPHSASRSGLVVETQLIQKDSADLANGEIAVILHDYVNSKDTSINGSSWAQNTVSGEGVEVDDEPYLVPVGEKGEVIFPLAFETNGGTFVKPAKDRYTYGEAYVFPEIVREHYEFNGWFANEACSGMAKFTQLTSAHHGPKKFYAKWDPKNYEIMVLANDPEMGSVSEGGIFAYGTEIDLVATAADGYQFSNWEDDLEALAERKVIVTGDKSYTAVFEKIPESSSNVVEQSSSSSNNSEVVSQSSSSFVEESASSSGANSSSAESSSSETSVVASSDSFCNSANCCSAGISSSSNAGVTSSNGASKPAVCSSSAAQGSSSSKKATLSSSGSVASSSSAKAESRSSSSAKSDSSKPKSSSGAVAKPGSSSVKSSSSQKADALVSAVTARFDVVVSGRTIQVAGARSGSAYAVLDLQGRVVRSGRVDFENFNVSVTRAGDYLVRVGKQIQKVQIK